MLPDVISSVLVCPGDYLQFCSFPSVPSLHHGDGVWKVHDRWVWHVQFPENGSVYCLFQPSWPQLRSHTGLFAATRILHLRKFLFSLSNQTTNNTEKGKGSDSHLGHQFSIFLLFPSYLHKATVPAGSASDHPKGHFNNHQSLLFSGSLQHLENKYQNTMQLWLIFHCMDSYFPY